MATNGFDISELDIYSQMILKMADKEMPKRTKKFLRQEGLKCKRATLKKAKQKVKKKDGNYYKGIKTGKVYKYDKSSAIRVYTGKPARHAHLLEYGHRLVQKSRVVNIDGKYVTLKSYPKGGREGVEVGFVQGYHVFEEAANEFKPTFYEDIENFVDEIAEEF